VNPLFTAPTPATSSVKSEVPSLEDLGKDATIKASDNVELSAGLESAKVAPRHRKQQQRVPRITYEDKSAQSNKHDHNSVRLESSADKSSDEHKSVDVIDSTTYTLSTKKKATVTLSDCLACSGCVTSAEAVLMSHHSIDKLKELCAQQKESEKQKKIVFTISPASLSDLYRHLYLEGNESDTSSKLPSRQWLLAKVAAFLHNEFGAEMVIDGTLPQTISLLESATEFCYRYRKRMSRDESKENTLSRQELPSIALSSTQTRFINKHSDTVSTGDDETLTEVTTVNHSPGLIIEEDGKEKAQSSTLKASSLPVLSSSCPGFVCLVEKTASAAVPFLSSAKSPMAVAGTLIKTGMCNKEIEATKDLFHVAIMPCHDKKLEAGRGDFSWEQQTLLNYGNAFQNATGTINESNGGNIVTEELVKEVDMVLTTGELLEILTETASNKISNATNAPSVHSIRCTLDELKNATAKDLVVLESEAEHLAADDGKNEQNIELYGSGSYADYIFRYAALDLFNCRVPLDEPLPWADSSQTNNPASNTGNSGGVIRRRRKRPDMSGLREVSLYKLADGTYSCIKPKDAESVEPVLKFATAYGFKNVQTVLQSLSKKTSSLEKRSDCHYIEIMACPSGCPNGGGQIGANGRKETPRETKERVRKVVQTVPRVRPQDGRLPLYYGRNEPFSQKARRIFHTRNHVVPELELSTGATAGVAVNDTKW
jgi:iron only hydrogenase large subunit-like protein